jgi:hypothetical protein
MRKVNDLSLIFIDFYVAVLTPHLSSNVTLLQLSENINSLSDLWHIYKCHTQRDIDRHQVFEAYFYIYIYIRRSYRKS